MLVCQAIQGLRRNLRHRLAARTRMAKKRVNCTSHTVGETEIGWIVTAGSGIQGEAGHHHPGQAIGQIILEVSGTQALSQVDAKLLPTIKAKVSDWVESL